MFLKSLCLTGAAKEVTDISRKNWSLPANYTDDN